MENTPELFRRVSNEAGHHSVPLAVAEAPGFRVLKQDAVDDNGHLLPFKPREDIAANGTETTEESE